MKHNSKSMTDIAIQYAENGIKCYPIVAGTKIPHKGSNGYKDGTNNIEAVKELFLKYDPESNIGNNLEETDIIVVDVDRHSVDKDGATSLQEIEEAYGVLPPTYTVSTPNGGTHYYYRLPGMNMKHNIVDFREGLDILATHVIAVPSTIIKTDGIVGSYRVVSGKITEIAMLPNFFVKLLSEHARKAEGRKHDCL
jgi:hypothetical protein